MDIWIWRHLNVCKLVHVIQNSKRGHERRNSQGPQRGLWGGPSGAEAAKSVVVGIGQGTLQCPHGASPARSYFGCNVLSHKDISTINVTLQGLCADMGLKWVEVLDEKQQNSSVSLWNFFFRREKKVDDNFPTICNDCAKPVFHVARSFNWVMIFWGKIIALCIKDTAS